MDTLTELKNWRANFQRSHFGQSRRWANILILKIRNVWMFIPPILAGRLKFSPALTLTKLKHFETGSWRIQIRPTLHWRLPESLLVNIGMDCIRMVAVVAFAALATLLIGT